MTHRAGFRRHSLVLGAVMVLMSVWMLEYSTFLVRSRFWDFVIKLGCLGPGLVLLVARPPARAYWRVIALYAALFATAVIGAVTTLDLVGILQVLKIALGFMILPVMLGLVSPGQAPPSVVIKTPVIWGVTFAIQAVALAAYSLSGRLPAAEPILIPRLGEQYRQTANPWFGIGVSSSDWGYYHQRAQGWFIEPSILGAFLIYPTVVLFGYYRQTGRLRYLLATVVCAAGLGFTVSVAAALGLAVSVLALVVFRPSARVHHRISLPILLRTGAMLIAFLWVSNFALQQAYAIRGSEGRGSAVGYLLGRDDDQTLIRGSARIDETLEVLSRRPLGVGLGGTLGTSELTSASALIYWIQAGGAPAAVALIGIYGTLFFSFCLPALRSGHQVHRHVAAAFLGVTVHNLSYGNWMAPFYLFGVGAMMICGESARRSAAARRATAATNARVGMAVARPIATEV